MSYCVNCGVELEASLKTCPLCSTPVINPNELKKEPAPYPLKKGTADPVRKSDTAILISVVLASTALASGLLNLFVFQANLWSLYLIFGCILIWVLISPVFTPKHVPTFVSILLDGAFVSLYCLFISLRHPGEGWFLELALPIIIFITIMLISFALYLRHFKTSILSGAAFCVIEIGLLCAGIDCLIHYYIEHKVYITWSSVVLVTCGVIAIALITIIKHNRLREEVRRRMHI